MADAAIAAMTAALLSQNQPFYRIWQTNPLTGESSQDITQWFVQFEYQATLISNLDDASKLTELKKSLHGRALSVFLSASVAEVNTYDSAKQFLQTNLAPLNQRALWQQEFQTRMKQESETIADYLRDLKRLVDLAFENEQDNAKTLVLKQKFINGLMVDNQSHLNHKLWKTAYKNMNESLETIVTAVSTTESNQRLFITAPTSRQDHEDVQAAVSPYRSAYQPHQRQYSRSIQSPRQCTYCGFPGHDVTDCRFLQAAKQRVQYGPNTNRCNHCAKPGHFRHDCWLYANAKVRLEGREPVTCSTSNNRQVRFQQPPNHRQQRIPVQAADIDFLGGEFMMCEDNDFNYPAHSTPGTSSIPVDDLTPHTKREDPHRRQWKRRTSKNKQRTNTESFQQPRRTVQEKTKNNNCSSQQSYPVVPMDSNNALEENKDQRQKSKNRRRRKQRPRTQPDITNAHDHSTVEPVVEKNIKRPQNPIPNKIGNASPCVEFVIKRNSIQVQAQDGSFVSIVKRSRNQCIVRIWSDPTTPQEANGPMIKKTRQVPSKGKPGRSKIPRPTGRKSKATAAAASSPVQSSPGDTQLDLSPPVVSSGSWSLFPFSSLWSSGGSRSSIGRSLSKEETQDNGPKTPKKSSPTIPETDEEFSDPQPQLETTTVQGQQMDPSTSQDATSTDQEEQFNGSEPEQVDKDFFCEDFDYPDMLIFDQPEISDDPAEILSMCLDDGSTTMVVEPTATVDPVSTPQFKSRKSRRRSNKAKGQLGR